jgi:hypothetical protein
MLVLSNVPNSKKLNAQRLNLRSHTTVVTHTTLGTPSAKYVSAQFLYENGHKIEIW